MKETIYSIPINEAFEIEDGDCPFCRLHRRLIEDTLEYTLGAAMMEPDVRERTNALGFCARHLDSLLARQKRLPLALVLETHIKELAKNPRLRYRTDSCFVCQRSDGFLQAYYANTVYLWRTEESFWQKWARQDSFCREHMAGLSHAATRDLPKRDAARFMRELDDKAEHQLRALADSLDIYIKSFDHRYADRELGEHVRAIPNAMWFLTGETK